MMAFQQSVSYSGNSQIAMNTLLQTLLPLGFQIIEQSEWALIVEGPGYNSTRQNALLGMSRGEFSFSRSTISINADLGGVDRMSRFLLFLLIGIGLFDAVVFTGLWFFIDALRAHQWFLAIPTLAILPWVFIAPIMTKWIRKHCEEAITNLLKNMASLA